MSRFLRIAGIALVVSYALLAVIHLSNGLEFGRAFAMPFQDYRAAIACPNDPSLVWEFINRSALEDDILNGLPASALYPDSCRGLR